MWFYSTKVSTNVLQKEIIEYIEEIREESDENYLKILSEEAKYYYPSLKQVEWIDITVLTRKIELNHF